MTSLKLLTLLALPALLLSCTAPDPAGEAATRNAIPDSALAALKPPLFLSDLETRFGLAEGQPGPRATYRAADHPGKFLWLHYRPAGDQLRIHHILLADRIEEKATVIWPPKWTTSTPKEASRHLDHFYPVPVNAE